MNVPQLRFDGFEGEWEVKKLNEIAKISSGGTPNRKKGEYWNGNIPWVTTSEVKFNNIFEAKEYITDKGLQESSAKIFPVDTILIAMYGQGQTRGKSAVLKIEAATNQACAAIKVEEDYESQLIYQLLSYKYDELRGLSNDGSQKNLSLGLLSSFKLKLPSLKEEQKKIARFMNYMDRRIGKQKEKIEKLEQLKKGVMQKIFLQELRFKDEDGGEFPEWEEKKLRSLITSKRKGTEAKYSEIGNILLHNDYLEFETNVKYVENKNDVTERDILILWDGSQAGNIYTKRTGVLGSTFVAISIKESYESYYIYHFLINNLSLIKVAWREGSGVPHVSKDFINNFSIKLPESKLEQEKIANFLFALEEKLTKEKEKLMVLEEQKKGFMQEMFV